MKLKLPLLVFVAFVIILTANLSYSQAKNWLYLENIDYPIASDYTLQPNDNNEISLKFFKDSTDTRLTLKMLTIVEKDNIGNFFTIPEGKSPATDLYFLNFTPISDNSFSIQPQATFKYEADDHFKEAYFYDWMILDFVKLDSVRDELNKTLTVTLPKRKKIMLVLLNESEIIGKASWYVHPKFENQLIAASRDFVIGTKVRVHNMSNNKEVIVTIKDFGPKKCIDWTDREQILMGPCQERVIDLSKLAFLELATSTGVGIISQVKVSPLIGLDK